MAGTLAENGTTLTSTATQDLTLSGLIAGPHTLNGSSTTKLKGVIADFFGSIDPRCDAVDHHHQPRDPRQGRVRRAALAIVGHDPPREHGHRRGAAIATIRITLDFSGTSTVNVSRTGPGGTQSCKMDLANLQQACQ